MEENKRTDSGYTGEYGNPVEHNDAPQVETENAAAYSETAQSASERAQAHRQSRAVLTATLTRMERAQAHTPEIIMAVELHSQIMNLRSKAEPVHSK